MWDLLCCCVILAIANPLWVQATPAIISYEEIAPNYVSAQPPPECPENEFFNHKGKACELTCALPVPPEKCDEIQIPACQCNEGYVRNETGVCVNVVQCLDNVPFNVDQNVPESSTHKVIVDDFLSTATETQTTDGPEYTVSSDVTTQYDTDESDDSHEDPRAFDPSTDIETAVLVDDPLTPDEILMLFEEQSEYSGIIEFLKAIIRNRMRKLEYHHSEYYGGNDLY